jgi:hypothetical protein
MRKNFRIPALIALLGGTVLAATPAAAAPITAADCAAQSGTVSVRAVAIAPGATITLFQTWDGTFQGEGSLQVYCRDAHTFGNLGDITDAQVKITINPATPGVTPDMFKITGVNGVGVANVNGATPGNPVQIGPFTGQAGFLITSPANLLAPGIAAEDVGVDFQVVTQAWGAPLKDPINGRILGPFAGGDIVAQTPELDSLALFGTGALGMLGYGLTRVRAARRSRS